MYETTTRIRRFAHYRCNHKGPHMLTPPQKDGTSVETCPRCSARWVIWPSGLRVRALFAP